jgi:hypothetical protein
MRSMEPTLTPLLALALVRQPGLEPRFILPTEVQPQNGSPLKAGMTDEWTLTLSLA